MSLNQRSVTAWKVKQQGERNPELGVGEGIDFPKFASLRFHQSEGLNNQLRKNGSFYRLSVFLAQCIIGLEKHLDVGINFSYPPGKQCQGFSQIVTCFEYLTEDDTLQSYMSQQDFWKNFINAFADPNKASGYNLIVFDIFTKPIFKPLKNVKESTSNSMKIFQLVQSHMLS